ncbi:MAG: hypothetical protein QGF21_14180 [Vicinamibacterales bacterium]|nr:hypothetical protein [Vicinamibacterales bacterium]MDP7478482.1 hypothetical protein [Vicinamibacterales bacterium]MDP7673076.1 hypothetical protein [Vicinamibacterales bacterium]HJO37372.1 hypothetical protein [Vicinamibacterales bacterium]
MRESRQAWGRVPLLAAIVVVTVGWGSGTARAQSASASAAETLGQAMDDAGLSAIAAKDSATDGRYVAALYFSGRQMLVVAAEYAAPQLLDVKIAAGNYRDVYVDLSSASVLETRLFIDDFGANGLQRAPTDGAADSATRGGQVLSFDGDPGSHRMSPAEYDEAYAAADEDLAAILALLTAHINES